MGFVAFPMPTTAVGLTNGNGGQDALRNHPTTKGEGHALERYMCARACFFQHNSSRMAGLKITQVDIVRLAIKHMPVDNSYEDFVRETALTIEEVTVCSRAEAVLLMYDAFGDILLMHYDIHADITGKDTIPAELKMKYNAFNGAMLKLAQAPEEGEGEAAAGPSEAEPAAATDAA